MVYTGARFRLRSIFSVARQTESGDKEDIEPDKPRGISAMIENCAIVP
jgi:hypothetical protein